MTKIIIPRSSIKDSNHLKLIVEKQRLQKLESAGKISEEELKEELKELNTRINFNVKLYIEDLIKKQDLVKKEKQDLIKKQDLVKKEKQDLIKKERRDLVKKEKQNIVKKEKPMEGKNKMAEEKTPVKPKRVTNTDIILDLLQKKGLKTVAEIVAKFKEKKPEANEKNVKQQVTEIIAWVKKGHKKYANYTWDSKAFLLTPKE